MHLLATLITTLWLQTVVSGTVRIDATATDNSDCIRYVRMRIDNTPQEPTLTNPPYQFLWDTTTTTPGPHTLQAIAEDCAGNIGESNVIAVTVANVVADYVRVESNSAGVRYDGSWQPTYFGGYSAGSSDLGWVAGDRITFTFTGTMARWIGFNSWSGGIAAVYIDGVRQADVDTFYFEGPLYYQLQAINYTTPALPYGSHTLTIEVTGRQNAGAYNSWIWVDAFEYR